MEEKNKITFEEQTKNNKEFFKNTLIICPICKNELINANNLLIKKVRDEGVLNMCPNCSIFIGRLT